MVTIGINQKSSILAIGVLGCWATSHGQLRELSTDRPDTTESPFTVDAGHFQIEVEAVAWSKEGGSKELSVGEINFKMGLDQLTDLQIVTPSYTWVRRGEEGWGDMQIRLKRNLWGNDGGNSALAVMPFIQLPTSEDDLGSDRVEGGIIVPFAFECGGGWGMGLQAELDLVHGDDDDYHWESLFSVTANRGITDECSVFFELVGVFRDEDEIKNEYYFNTGLTYLVNSSLQWDGGVRIGLSDESTDFTPFIGFSRKF